LTGRPPFKAATSQETLELVRTAEPLAPGRLRPNLPRDLEIICLKCLQKAPGKRYGSALELAEDLRRFQDGRPIRARPTPLWERGLKGARRRPAAAALLGVSGLAAAVVLAVVLVWQARLVRERDHADLQRRQAETNFREAEQQRRQAVANFRKARDA